MKNYFFSILSLLLSFQTAFAQQRTKVNAEVVRVMKEKELSNVMLNLLVKGDIKTIMRLTAEAGGIFKYSAGNIAAVKIPGNAIEYFTTNKNIERIESYKHRMTALNDTMRVRNNVNEVQQGVFPLTQGYDGSGVVLGFIDSGIDYLHPDFIDSANHSRIKWIWDMAMPDSLNTPTPFGYGQEWDNTQIDAGKAGNQSAFRDFGHGTHVSGIGVSNGRAANANKGVAPKADIIMVAYDFTYYGSETRIADAVHYIFSKAEAMGKPCVINASLGDYFGSHDGGDLEAQLIDAELTAKPGRCMVAAGGNWGNLYIHLGYTVSNADTNFTWYKNNSNNAIYMQLWSDSNTFKNIRFALAAEDTTNYSIRATWPFSTIMSHLTQDTTEIFNGTNRIGTIISLASTQGNLYLQELLIKPDSASYLWRLMTTGNGRFDLWSLDHYKGALPSPTILPSIVFYKSPDLSMNLSNSFACSDQVITVANYIDRNTHTTCADSVIITTEIPGALKDHSSIGPTRDGRQKPDIAATGDHIMSCAVTPWLGNVIPLTSTNLDKSCYHIRGGGTSSAAPVVAGIAALYLQKYPSATNIDIKNAITGCAKTDAQTGAALPDYRWGYGKVDAFHVMTGCPTGLEESFYDLSAVIYPNPFSKSATLFLPNFKPQNSNFKLIIYDITGRALSELEIRNAKSEIERGSLTNGMYLYNIVIGKRIMARGKMIVQD